MKAKTKFWNVPNILTLVRLALVAVVIYFFVTHQMVGALVCFLAAGATDLLDGYIARKYDLITPWGKLLDPLADKLMLLTVLTCFLIQGVIPVWILCLVLCKELAMIVGAFCLLKTRKVVVYANIFGKLGTFAFTVAVVLLFLHQWVVPWDQIMLYIAVGMSIISMVQYGVRNVLRKGHEEDGEVLEDSD